MDYGYHCHLGRTVQLHISADDSMLKSRQGCLDLLNQRIRDLDQRSDKQTFLELLGQPFVLPKLFELQPHRGDEVCLISLLHVLLFLSDNNFLIRMLYKDWLLHNQSFHYFIYMFDYYCLLKCVLSVIY